jgi:penicillin-binding protein 1A
MLEGVLDAGTASSARSAGFRRPAAGKTGTTNDYRDAWFVGFTPDLVAAVWVGFDQRYPLGMSGGTAALPLWTTFMKEATAALPPRPFLPPPGVTMVRLDRASGEVLSPDADPQSAVTEAFLDADAPAATAFEHEAIPAAEPAPAPSPGGTQPLREERLAWHDDGRAPQTAER